MVKRSSWLWPKRGFGAASACVSGSQGFYSRVLQQSVVDLMNLLDVQEAKRPGCCLSGSAT